MSTPTPAELATFLRALRDEMPSGSPEGFGFYEALHWWHEWEWEIENAEKQSRSHHAQEAEFYRRVSFAETLREMSGCTERTLRSYFDVIVANNDYTDEEWPDRVKNGFTRDEIETMKRIRNRRASEKARLGGVKKSMQEKKRRQRLQASAADTQAGAARPPRNPK